MAIYVIPLSDIQDGVQINQVIDFDGVDYRLKFHYNSREGFWYFDLLNQDGTQLRSGSKVVSNYPVIRLMMNTPRPEGELWFIDTNYRPADPDFDALNVDSVMTYSQAGT